MLDSIERNKMMVVKLIRECDHGRIENEFAMNFIYSIKNRVYANTPLTEKQQAKLDEIFDKY